MNPRLKKALSYIIPLFLGFALLYWVFNEVDLKKTFQDFKNANYFLVFLAAILALMSHIVRAARWNLMLESLGYNPSLYNSTISILIGYITNLVFPRAGEVARSVNLQKSENIPFDKSFGAVIAERFIDVIMALVLLLVNILLAKDLILGLLHELFPNFKFNWLFPAAFGSLFLGAFLFFRFKDKIFELPLLNRFKGFFEGLKDGFLSVLKLKRPWMFVLQSFLIWILYYFISMTLCYAVQTGESLSALAILTILVMGSVGMAIPTVGGIGSYHLLVGKIVTLFGLSNQDGVSLATFLHSMNGIVFVVVFGLVALVLSAISKPKVD